jgi:hypothetical protein
MTLKYKRIIAVMKRFRPDTTHNDVELDNVLKSMSAKKKDPQFIDWEDTWSRFGAVLNYCIRHRHDHKRQQAVA